MTLTEFLLARIEEDEAVSFQIISDPRNPGYVGHECLICPDGPSFGGTIHAITEIAEEHAEGIHGRSRVLAECEAKRGIVGIYQHIEAADDLAHPQLGMIATGALMSMRHLARAYADHAGYEREWRP